MEERILGGSLKVSAVGLGCMGLSHAYGAPKEKKEAIGLIRTAFEMGYTFFDTAEGYIGTNADGTPSNNEELVGEALGEVRNHAVIATKFGIKAAGPEALLDSRPETIRASVEGSLRRLRTDHIDLYYQHRVDPKVPVEAVAETMAELIKEGKILHWGISEANAKVIREAHAICPLTAIQNRYSMMARWHEELFPVLKELNIGFVAFSPMANGYLSGKYGKRDRFDADTDYRSGMPQFTAEAEEKNRELLQIIRRLAQEKDATSAQISLAWMLCKNPQIVPIPGTTKTERLKENAGAADVKLTDAEIRALDEALEAVPMSEVYGGIRYINRKK